MVLTKILSMLDGRAMDVTNYGSSGAGTNVQVYDEWDSTAQRFNLYYLDSAYYVKPICCDMVLDLSAQTSNLQVWGRGDNWNTQKFDIYKIDKNEIGHHSYEQEIIPPTCTANGYTNYVCSECGDAYQGTIHKPGSTALLIGRYQKKLLVQKMENVSEAAVNAA